MTNTRTTSSPLSQVLKTSDFGNFKNCELNIGITLIYPCLHPLMYYACRNPQRRASPYIGICTSGMYCFLLLSSAKEIFHYKGRLIDNVVGFSTIPEAGEGILIHPLYVSLVSSQMETVSKTCLFKIGQYHLALLKSPNPRKKPTNLCSEVF